ncbi:hypothetical protein BJ165DRAFT_1417483 [Panaeolus papilionaceus]|nr:hypothetical protein BJ165DRAFT_1417483 [Panaeolus papilionaceus]
MGIQKLERDIDELGNSTRTATMIRLDIVRHAIHKEHQMLPSDKGIWCSLQNKDISKKIRSFMWTAMHNAQRIGEYWQNKTNYEHRGKCRPCDTTESLEHILTECKTSGQEIAWDLAKRLIAKKDPNWRKPSLGEMLGQGYIHPGAKLSKNKKGIQRLKRIIITETMYLIWKIRCEWKISRNEDLSKLHGRKEILSKWHSVINSRLKIDCLLTNRKKYGNRALNKGLVKDTWTGTLENEENLVEEWTEPGVLVGIARES